MTKTELIEKIQNGLDFSKKDSSDLLESVFSIMKNTLASGESIKISGFGKFDIKHKKDRRGRNPKTGETIILEARRIVAFKPSPVLRESIKAPVIAQKSSGVKTTS